MFEIFHMNLDSFNTSEPCVQNQGCMLGIFSIVVDRTMVQ